jgi:hypothetical protein
LLINPAACGVLDDPLADIVGGVHGHHLAGDDDVDLLRLVLADRHGEAAADDVAEDVVKDVVEVGGVGAFFLEEVDGGDDAAPGAADARLGTARLDAHDVAVASFEDILELQVLDGAEFTNLVHDGRLGLGVQDQAGRVGLGIAADDENPLAEGGESGHGVLGGGGFADAAFAVDCDLT